MKIAVSAQGEDINAMINPRFGRCEYFLIVDTETNQVEACPNENINASGGAGIQSATFVISKGVQAVLTGDVGPKAMDVFAGSGVNIITGQSGTVKQAIEQFTAGSHEKAGTSSSLGNDSGSGPGMGGGSGQGGGRGMGGCGRGMGGGGRGMGGCGRGMGGGGGRRRQ